VRVEVPCVLAGADCVEERMKLILAAFVAVLPSGASAQTTNKPDLQTAADPG